MSPDDGLEARLADVPADSLSAQKVGQENLHTHTATPSQDADRAPLKVLAQGRSQAAQRPRLKHPGSLTLTKMLGAPVRKSTRAPERAPEAPAEASLPAGGASPQTHGAGWSHSDGSKEPGTKDTGKNGHQAAMPSRELGLTVQHPLSSSRRPSGLHAARHITPTGDTSGSAAEVSLSKCHKHCESSFVKHSNFAC